MRAPRRTSTLLVAALAVGACGVEVREKTPASLAPTVRAGGSSVRDAAEVARATQSILNNPPFPLAISPDGAQLLMQNEDATGFHLTVVERSSGKVLGEIPTGSRPRLASWSPDGAKIAYSPDAGGAEYALFIWDLKTGRTFRTQGATTQIVTRAKWTADSRFLTHVVEKRGGARDLYRLESVEGAVPEPVALGITPKAGIAWSVDGRKLATVLAKDPHAIAVVVLGAGVERIPVEGDAEVRDLAFSPNGKELVFTARKKAEKSFRLGAADGSGKVRALPQPPLEGDVVGPLFQAQGERLLYVVNGSEKQSFGCGREGDGCLALGPRGQVSSWGASTDGRKLFIGQVTPRKVFEVDVETAQATLVWETRATDELDANTARIDVPSYDGLGIPVLYRNASPQPGHEPALCIQVLGGIGKESAPPWDTRARYLYERGITMLKVYVRGKAGFGRKLLDAPGGELGRARDIRAVVEYATRTYRVPSSRIVLFGHSDGAFLAAKAVATGASVGGLVLSSMVKDPTPAPPQSTSCAVAFHGSRDRMAPTDARAEIERMLGRGATTEPCGRFHVLEGEAHELERAESWAEIYAAIVMSVLPKP